MLKWKRKLLFFLTTVCLFAFSTATVACKDDEEETDDGVQVGEQVETMLDLNYRYYELEIYDNVTLYPVLQKEEGEIVEGFVARCAQVAEDYFDNFEFIDIVDKELAEEMGLDTY